MYDFHPTIVGGGRWPPQPPPPHPINRSLLQRLCPRRTKALPFHSLRICIYLFFRPHGGASQRRAGCARFVTTRAFRLATRVPGRVYCKNTKNQRRRRRLPLPPPPPRTVQNQYTPPTPPQLMQPRSRGVCADDRDAGRAAERPEKFYSENKSGNVARVRTRMVR